MISAEQAAEHYNGAESWKLPALEQSPAEADEGHLIGRDPRQMSVADLNAMGHDEQPLLKVIRAKCLDCAGNQESEVRKCVSVDCANWPYRMARNPFRHKQLSEEQREAARDRMQHARAQKFAS